MGKEQWFKQYDDLKKAIPNEWVERIDKNEVGEEGGMPELYFKKENGEKCFLIECKVKQIYLVFREKTFIKPVANNYWIKRYDDLSEGEIWRNLGMKCMDPILENLLFY